MNKTILPDERKLHVYDSTKIPPEFRRALLIAMMGPDVVIVAMKKGTKQVLKRGKLDRYPAMMSDPGYLKLLESPEVDLGVLSGRDSGGICAFDLDGIEAVNLWESQVTPQLSSLPASVVVRSKNGVKHFFKVSGEFPAKVVHFGETDGKRFGEFRGGGCVTKVMGTHPEGGPYVIEWSGTGPAATISLGQLEMPPEFNFPPAPEADALYMKAGNSVHLDHWALANAIAATHPIVYDTARQSFFLWGETEKHYAEQAASQVRKLAADFIGRLGKETAEGGLRIKRSSNEMRSILMALEGEATKPVTMESAANQAKFFPAANGDVEIASGTVLSPTPDRAFLFRSAVPYMADAECPKFRNWLSEMFPEEGATRIVQLAFGQIILGTNISKKIFAISGPTNAGKSTLVRLLQNLAGSDSFGELRTRHLDERFEMGAFLGKTTLVALDAPPNFLLHHGAQQLKSLTGGDTKAVEIKKESAHQKMRGDRNIILCSNQPLSIATFGDPSAFIERIVPLSAHAFSGTMIAGFEDLLLREEGAGILNWILAGAKELLASANPSALFALGEAHKRVLFTRLDVPGLIHQFAKEKLILAPGNEVQIDELLLAFHNWRSGIGAEEIPVTPDGFGRHLKSALLAIPGLAGHRNTLVSKGGMRRRGYAGFAVRL